MNGSITNKTILASWLERLAEADWSEDPLFELMNRNPNRSAANGIHTLLSPKDPQDVPRAIKLLSRTAEIANIDVSNLNPSERATHHALALIGAMLHALVEPFINPTLSLSVQITSLVTFSHILCALFQKHESDFMPLHLYSDLQCMVRTAIFRVAHTKILDPARKVFLCLLGDDVLEVLFGRVRMIGAHSPNVAADELRDRIGSTLRLDCIFQDNPAWERRPERLKMQRSRDVDHLTPPYWTGELSASSCNLSACWADGVKKAEEILSKHGCPVNFAEVFFDSHRRGVDILRPKGGKYPGISAEVDRSIIDVLEGDEAINVEEDFNFHHFNAREVLESEIASARQFPLHSVWLEFGEGRKIHKKSALRVFMDSALDLDYPASHDRMLRVRGFSIGGDNWDRSKALSLGASRPSLNTFRLGSLYATLVSINLNTVTLVIVQCTSLKNGSELVYQAPRDEVHLLNSAYKVGDQILSLVPFITSDQAISWVWNTAQRYVGLNTSKAKPQKVPTTTRAHHLNFHVNGSIIYPLYTTDYSEAPMDDPTLEDLAASSRSTDNTWLLSETTLTRIQRQLEQRLDPMDRNGATLHGRIPIFGTVRQGSLPYRAETFGKTLTRLSFSTFLIIFGSADILSNPCTITHISSLKAPQLESAPQACHICRKQVGGSDRQNHMGEHILRKLRGVEEHFEQQVISVSISALLTDSFDRSHLAILVDFVVNQWHHQKVAIARYQYEAGRPILDACLHIALSFALHQNLQDSRNALMSPFSAPSARISIGNTISGTIFKSDIHLGK